jgi:hypothetical protein
MARWMHRDAQGTHRTVSAGILDALGRGFLIATAGVVAGTMFGTANLAAISLWTIPVAAASGVGCMIGSVLVKHAGSDRYGRKTGGAPRAATVRTAKAPEPAVEPAEAADVEEHRARRRVISGRQREQGAGRGV